MASTQFNKKNTKKVNWITKKSLCQDFPELKLNKIKDNFCVGLVSENDFTFPRYMVQSKQGQIYLVDKGSQLFDRDSRPGKGKVWQLNIKPGKFSKKLILNKLMAPSGIAYWTGNQSDEFLYINESDRILRFNLRTQQKEVVIKNIPNQGWHFLSSLKIFENKLYLNVGSQTDHCENNISSNGNCFEELRKNGSAQIRIYSILKDGNIDPNYKILAKGLRNSMAITLDKETKILYQAENGWDDIDLSNIPYNENNFPHDELNIIKAGKHYGWPYCFDNDLKTPGFDKNCKNYIKPTRLLPPHSAPLDLLVLKKDNFINKQKTLLISFHGFKKHGRRLSYLTLKENGELAPEKLDLVVFEQQNKKHEKLGRPLSLLHFNNSILVTDDWNRSIYIISKK